VEPQELESNATLTEQQREAALRLVKLGMRIEVFGEVVSAWFRNHCFVIKRSGEVVEL
jgi:hypothetical protein